MSSQFNFTDNLISTILAFLCLFMNSDNCQNILVGEKLNCNGKLFAGQIFESNLN